MPFFGGVTASGATCNGTNIVSGCGVPPDSAVANFNNSLMFGATVAPNQLLSDNNILVGTGIFDGVGKIEDINSVGNVILASNAFSTVSPGGAGYYVRAASLQLVESVCIGASDPDNLFGTPLAFFGNSGFTSLNKFSAQTSVYIGARNFYFDNKPNLEGQDFTVGFPGSTPQDGHVFVGYGNGMQASSGTPPGTVIIGMDNILSTGNSVAFGGGNTTSVIIGQSNDVGDGVTFPFNVGSGVVLGHGNVAPANFCFIIGNSNIVGTTAADSDIVVFGRSCTLNGVNNFGVECGAITVTDSNMSYIGGSGASSHGIMLGEGRAEPLTFAGRGSVFFDSTFDGLSVKRGSGIKRAIEHGSQGWCNFNGTLAGPITPRDDFRVTDVTKSATGSYIVNFSPSFTNTNYAVIGSANNNCAVIVGAKALGTVAITTVDNLTGVLTDCSEISIAVFGGA